MSEFSHKRIESHMIEAISLMIVRGEIKNPGLSRFVSISEIILSPDVSHARIKVSTFEDESALNRSVRALNSASGFIQKRIAKVLKTRNTPILEFVADKSIRDGMQVNQLIDKLHDHGDE